MALHLDAGVDVANRRTNTPGQHHHDARNASFVSRLSRVQECLMKPLFSQSNAFQDLRGRSWRVLIQRNILHRWLSPFDVLATTGIRLYGGVR